jgi:hypothetical protein
LEACAKGVTLANQANVDFDTLSWKKTPLRKNFDYGRDVSVAKLTGRFSLTKSDALSLTFNGYTTISLDEATDAEVIFYDADVQFNKIRVKTLLLQDRNKEYILFSKKDEMESFLLDCQRKDYRSTSDLPMPDKDDVTYKSVSRSKVQLKHRGGGGSWMNLTSSFDEINKMEDTCWAPLNGGGSEPWDDAADRKAYELITKFHSIKIVGVPKSLKRKAKYIELPTIQEFVRAKLIEIINTEERYEAAFMHRSTITWLSNLNTYVDKKRWNDLDVVLAAQLHSDTVTLWRSRESISQFTGWKLKPRTDKQIEARDAKLAKGHDLLSVVDNIYGRSLSKTQFVEEILTLIHRRK